MIESKIAGDAKHPCPLLACIGGRHDTARDAQKDFLREIRRVGRTDDPAQVTENPVPIGRKEQVWGPTPRVSCPNKHQDGLILSAES